jgi:hypothetical protein
MNTGPMRAPALLLALLVIPATADARPRKKAKAAAKAGKAGNVASACGARVLPLAKGTIWTYAPVVAPLPPSDAVKRIAPLQPKEITISVKSIEAKGTETVVTLEEKLTIDRTKDEKKPLVEERAYETTITCSDKKFDISPDSFLFAGEPGGYLGLEITKLSRVKGTSLQLVKGGIGEAEWREDLVVEWSQTPTKKTGAKLANGKLELERVFTPQLPEPVTTKMGMFRAEKLGLITTGRVTLEDASPQTKPMELPAGWVSHLWLADGVGMIQALNSFGHMYQLVDSTDAGERAADESKK